MKRIIAALGLLGVLGVTGAYGHGETKSEPQPNKAFSTEQVLTVSAGDYVQSKSNSLTQYEMKGVHILCNNFECAEKLVEETLRKYPQVEVVVNYDQNLQYFKSKFENSSCFGTALIPKMTSVNR